jgi:transglutaminase-like putative cysteine protease
MDSAIDPPPVPDSWPDADAFAPAAAAPETTTIGSIPAHLLERITIGPPPAWVVERPVEIEKEARGGINPVYLLDSQDHAGRNESYQRSVQRLGTMNQVHEASQWRVNMDPLTSRLTIHALLVRRADNSVDNARLDRLRVLQREERLEALTLRGELTVVALLEDVRVGDVLDLSYTIQTRDQIFPDRFRCFSFIPHYTVRQLYWSVRFPTGRAMRWKSSDAKLVPTIREEGGETEWAWHLSKLPGAEPEPNVPGWHFAHPWIQVTEFASWGEVAAGLAAAWKEELDHPEILRLVESITAQAATPAERAEQALTYLQDDIRYLSVDTALGGGVPTSPGTVIRRGFGDCKDKSFAAAHILRRLGIPARPVCVHTAWRQAVDGFLPTPAAFNHVIVEFEIEGRRRWVDVTVSLQGGSILSRPAPEFRLGLPIGPGVEDLEDIPSDKSNDFTEVKETYVIDTSGRTSVLRVRVTARGREAELWRHSLKFDGETKFARQREEFHRRRFASLQRMGKLEWHDDRAHNELEIGEAFEVRELVRPIENGRAYVFQFFPHTIAAALHLAETETRRSPWALPFPCHLRHIIEIEAQGLPRIVLKTSQVEGKAFRFSCQFQQRVESLTASYDLKTLAGHVSSEEFEKHKLKVRETASYLYVAVHLPRGSTAPWKLRAPNSLLSRSRASAAAISEPRPRDPKPAEAAENFAPPVPALGEAAPALPSRAPRDRSTVRPRAEKTTRTAEAAEPRQRENIDRPNPRPQPAIEAPRARRSGRGASRRHRRRQREQWTLWIACICGAAALAGMILFLLRTQR